MSKSLVISSRNVAQHWILLGIPVLFIIGFFMHYIYEWSGDSTIVGIFAPVNESVWEHLKLTFWPMLIWWITGYIILARNNKISVSQWFNSCTVAVLVCPLAVLCFYYTYTGAFGIESLILDIFSLFLGVTVAQGLALHVYKYAIFIQYCLYISVAILILLAVTFFVFTFAPPHIPLFKDSVTRKCSLGYANFARKQNNITVGKLPVIKKIEPLNYILLLDRTFLSQKTNITISS